MIFQSSIQRDSEEKRLGVIVSYRVFIFLLFHIILPLAHKDNAFSITIQIPYVFLAFIALMIRSPIDVRTFHTKILLSLYAKERESGARPEQYPLL